MSLSTSVLSSADDGSQIEPIRLSYQLFFQSREETRLLADQLKKLYGYGQRKTNMMCRDIIG